MCAPRGSLSRCHLARGLVLCRGGRHLATGSDDKLVCIYELRAGTGQAAFGSSEGPNVENWKLSATLRGHSFHVIDVAWSLEDTYLASCRQAQRTFSHLAPTRVLLQQSGGLHTGE